MGRARRSREGRRRRAGAGFTIIEILVVLAVIAIVAAIAVPNFVEALDRARRMAAYSSASQLVSGMHRYMVEQDAAPMAVHVETLEPLVSAGALTEQQVRAILNTFENERLIYYWAANGWWMDGGYYYEMGFRPKGDDDPWSMCYVWEDEIWRWDQTDGWHQPLRLN